MSDPSAPSLVGSRASLFASVASAGGEHADAARQARRSRRAGQGRPSRNRPLPPPRPPDRRAGQGRAARSQGDADAAARPAALAAPAKDAPKTPQLTADEAVAKANAYLDSARVMSADFVQIGPDGARSEGQLYVARPGRMLFRFAPPARLEIVADGRSVAVRDQKLDTQDLYLIAQTPLKFLLADHIDIAKDTKVKRVAIDDNAATIEIEDKATFGGTAEIALVFDPTLRAEAMDRPRRAGLSDGRQPVQRRFDHPARSRPLPHRRGDAADQPQVARRAAGAKRRAPRRLWASRPRPLRPRRSSRHLRPPLEEGSPLRFSIATWNINSVRLRIDLVARFLDEHAPDVLCLQETKCPDGQFPLGEFREAGLRHIAINGQKGYHGVAIVSRLPFVEATPRELLRQGRLAPHRGDARRQAPAARAAQFLRARRRRRARSRRSTPNSPTSSISSTRWRRGSRDESKRRRPRDPGRRSQHRAARARRLEPQGAAQRRQPHARSRSRSSAARRPPVPGSTRCASSCRRTRSSTPGGATARPTGPGRQGPPARPHLGQPGARRRGESMQVLREARGWERPSDHVPVMVELSLWNVSSRRKSSPA